MNDHFYLSPSKMSELTTNLTGSEIKMLLAIMYCLSMDNTKLFVNNRRNRERMKEIDFDKTPVRISMLLSLLAKKGVIIREANALYRLPDGLFLLSKEVKE